MPRLIDQPISPTLTRDERFEQLRPASFTWRGSRYWVAGVQDRWNEIGRWWEKDVELAVWRVLLQGGGVTELAMAHKQPPEWRLMAIYD